MLFNVTIETMKIQWRITSIENYNSEVGWIIRKNNLNTRHFLLKIWRLDTTHHTVKSSQLTNQ